MALFAPNNCILTVMQGDVVKMIMKMYGLDPLRTHGFRLWMRVHICI